MYDPTYADTTYSDSAVAETPYAVDDSGLVGDATAGVDFGFPGLDPGSSPDFLGFTYAGPDNIDPGQQADSNLNQFATSPDGSVVQMPDGSLILTNPDGSTSVMGNDGNPMGYTDSGTTRTYSNGLIQDLTNGSYVDQNGNPIDVYSWGTTLDANGSPTTGFGASGQSNGKPAVQNAGFLTGLTNGLRGLFQSFGKLGAGTGSLLGGTTKPVYAPGTPQYQMAGQPVPLLGSTTSFTGAIAVAVIGGLIVLLLAPRILKGAA